MPGSVGKPTGVHDDTKREEPNSRPGEDDGCDALEHLQDKVYREELRPVLVASGHRMEGGGRGEWEGRRAEKDGRLALGVLYQECGADRSAKPRPADTTYIILETIPMAPGIML